MDFRAARRPVGVGKAVRQGRGRPRERGAGPRPEARSVRSTVVTAARASLTLVPGYLASVRCARVVRWSLCSPLVTGRPANLRNPEQFRFLLPPESALGGSDISLGLCGPDSASLSVSSFVSFPGCPSRGFTSHSGRCPRLPRGSLSPRQPSSGSRPEPARWGRLPALPCPALHVCGQPAGRPGLRRLACDVGPCGAPGTAWHVVTAEAFAAVLAVSTARMTL